VRCGVQALLRNDVGVLIAAPTDQGEGAASITLFKKPTNVKRKKPKTKALDEDVYLAGAVRVFRQESTLEDAIGSHAC
jgi:hypothetical protein